MGGLLHLVQRGDWAGWGPGQSPPRCTKCNSSPINGQCTNHCIAIMMVHLLCAFNVAIKGLTLTDTQCDLRKLPSKTVTHHRIYMLYSFT